MADPIANPLSSTQITDGTVTDGTVTDGTTDSTTSTGASGQAGFCSADERISTHTCNSLNPAIAMDYYGNRGIVWQDNRDGDFEIYLKFVASLLSTESQAQALSTFYDPKSGRIGSFPCSGISGFSGFSGLNLSDKDLLLLNSRCVKDDNADTALLRFSEGKLDVNQQLNIAYLTSGPGDDFLKSAVNPGATVVIETGLNANKNLLVVAAVSNKTLQVSYDPSLRNDSGFIYSVTSNPQIKLNSCELRLTCEKGASLFPDVVADRKCRWHVVYQDDKSGSNEIYYVQIGPPEKVLKTCPPNTPNISKSGGGFSDLPGYVSGKTYVYQTQAGKKYYSITGNVGDFFAYGNRNLPTPEGSGQHVLFRDWYGNDGKWIGLSKKSDLQTWKDQAATVGNVPSPISYEYKTPFTEGGEFGSVYDFKHLAFQIQAPPDLGIDLRTVSLPVFPRCTPSTDVKTLSNPLTQDLTEAPKKPLPPTFVDPVDISNILTSPYVTFTSEPSRFTVEGDNSGTVYTNVLLEDSSGELSRILFKKDIDGKLVKFVLGMSKCGNTNCSVKVSSASKSIESPNDNRYSLRLQIWEGPDYRLDAEFLDSASTVSINLLLDKEYYFDPNENFTTFTFEPNEVLVPRGSILYFALIPSENSDYAVMAKGPGTTIWTSNDTSGNFNQYNTPYTLPPYQGLSAPVYYDGYLSDIANESESTDGDGDGDGSGDPNKTKPVVLMSLNQPHGVAFLPSYNKLIVNETRRYTSTIDYESTKQPLYTITSYLSFYSRFCSTWEDVGKHKAGTTYFTETNHVAKINYDKTIQDQWVLIPTLRDVCIDYSGNWDQDLLCISNNDYNHGKTPRTTIVSRVDPDTGSVTKITEIPFAFTMGMVSIPNNPEKYGTYAGKLWIGRYPYKGGYLINKDGSYRGVNDFNGIISNLNLIPPNSHMYVIDAYYSKLYGLHKSQFEENIGDIIISSPWQNVYILSFKNGFNLRPLFKDGPIGSFQQTNFAPYGIMPLCKNEKDCECATQDCDGKEDPERPEAEICSDVERFVFTPPLRLTNSTDRQSEHPRFAISTNDNIWVTFHSDRDGSYDVYASRFSSICDVWNASSTGGEDIRVSNFSRLNRRAMFPNIAIGLNGIVHIAFQAIDEDGRWQIFYTRSTSGNTNFSEPIQITKSVTGALMPDIEVSYEDKKEVVTIVWHDDRSGKYQIYVAQKKTGSWRSSYQDGADVRVTNSIGSDMFPRIKADPSGNLRVVFRTDRTGREEIFMSTYVATAQTWSSSGTGQNEVKVSTGPLNSMFPDLDIDKQGGTAVTWHDDRHITENPDIHEEVYDNYCVSLTHVGGPHFPPLVTNDEVFLDREFSFVDCVDYQPVSLTTTPEVCLKIRAPGATFWRAANAGQSFSDWTSFKPNIDLETMTIPWKLTCGNGVKEVCVQVQNQNSVGFPLCKTVSLVSPPLDFDIQFYSDEGMTVSLPYFEDRPAIKAGDIWIKITSPQPVLLPPTFDVVHQGYRIITNQKTEAISGVQGTAGIGSFIGQNYNGTFSSMSLQQFTGKFTIHKEDGYNYKDGLARVVVKERTVCDDYNDISIKTSTATSCASEKELPAGPPPVYSGTSGSSGPSGASGMHGPYNPSSPIDPVSMYITITRTTDSGQTIITPTINAVPYKVTMGAIAQPFSPPFTIATNLNIVFKGARRKVPAWLSLFQSRKLRVDLIENILTTPIVIGTAYIDALTLPEVDFDPITGLMIDPASLADISDTIVQIGGNPTLNFGTVYGISFSDETYYPLLGTYGANAKYFVVAYGTSRVVPVDPYGYYYRDY